MTAVESDLDLVRDEIAATLSRVAAHAAAGSCHAQCGTDAMLAAEMRFCAANLLSASALVAELAPTRRAFAPSVSGDAA